MESRTLRTIVQWLHLSAAAGLVGSALFILVALSRFLGTPKGEAGAFVGPAVVDRWYSFFPWVGLAVFLTTGILNFLFWLADAGLTLKQSLGTTYVKLLALKLLLANAVLLIGILLGFLPGMQEDYTAWVAVILALVVPIVLISAALRRYRLGAEELARIGPPGVQSAAS